MNCGVGHRHILDLALLWLWCRLTTAALICPLVWELPYATSVALKNDPKFKKKSKSKSKSTTLIIFIYLYFLFFLSFCLF